VLLLLLLLPLLMGVAFHLAAAAAAAAHRCFCCCCWRWQAPGERTPGRQQADISGLKEGQAHSRREHAPLGGVLEQALLRL
jgi:hypothetical protein